MVNITIEAINKDDLIHILSEADLLEDPTSEEAKKFQKSLFLYAEAISNMVLAQGLSTVAKLDSGDAVGAMVVTDFAQEKTPEFVEYLKSDPYFSEFHDYEDNFYNEYAKFHKFERKSFPKKHTIVLWICGTLLSHRKLGIEEEIQKKALEDYKARGYQYIVAFTYSTITHGRCVEFGYEPFSDINLSSAHVIGDGKVNFMVKKL